MFSLNDQMRYYLFNRPTDMRKSFHTLGGIVTDVMGHDPYDGNVYIFMNRPRNRIKLPHWEPGGVNFLCLQYVVHRVLTNKVVELMLERGFSRPLTYDTVIYLMNHIETIDRELADKANSLISEELNSLFGKFE